MFRRHNEQINSRSVLNNDQFHNATSYLASTRRLLFLRGLISGWPGPTGSGLVGRDDVFSPIDVIDDILAMNVADPERPIYLMIESVGGMIDVGLMVCDVVRMSKAPVITIGMNCSSMATLILSAGRERLAFPNSHFMLHLPRGGVQGDSRDVEILNKEMTKIKDSLVDLYIYHGVTAGIPGSGRAKIKKKILKDIDREYYLTTPEAIEYGLVDRVVTPDDLFGKNSVVEATIMTELIESVEETGYGTTAE